MDKGRRDTPREWIMIRKEKAVYLNEALKGIRVVHFEELEESPNSVDVMRPVYGVFDRIIGHKTSFISQPTCLVPGAIAGTIPFIVPGSFIVDRCCTD